MGSSRVERRKQFCGRCGQLMFDYFRSPDGHFGLVGLAAGGGRTRQNAGHPFEVRCPTCKARYRLLDRLNSLGQPVARL